MPPAGEISEEEGGSEGVDGGVEGKMFHTVGDTPPTTTAQDFSDAQRVCA